MIVPSSPVQAGDSVDVSGFNLAGVNVLRIGSLPVPFTHDVDAAHGLTFTVPASALTGKLFVLSPTDGSSTSTGNLLIRPRITSTSVSGSSVTLTGTTFTGSTVRFPALNGSQTVAAAASILNGGTTLKTTIPAAAVTGRILVTNPGGSDQSDVVHVVPRIASLSPGAGRVGTQVTLNGFGFDSTSAVSFDGTPASLVVVSSANKLVATVPDGAKTGTVSVATESGAGGPATFPTPFKVGPLITTFTSPVRADQQVAVQGFNLDEVQMLKLGSLAITPDDEAAHILHFTVPDNGTTGKLFVQTTSGSFTTSGSLGVAPTIDPLTVTSGPAGTALTLTGKTLGGSTIKFTSLAGAQTASASAAVGVGGTTLKTVVPAAAVTGPILVKNPGGQTLTGTFTVDPKITAFFPSSGPTGTTVTVNGSGFDSTSTLAVGGVGQGATVSAPTSANSVKLRVPNGVDNGTLMVTTTGGGKSLPSTATFNVTMSILDAPTVGSPGADVTITGKGFGQHPVVTFTGATPIDATSDGTSIHVTVPQVVATGPITVKNGSTTVQSANGFEIPPSPPPYRFMYSSDPAAAMVASYGWNLIDVGSQWSADQLPVGEKGLVWVGDYDNSTCTWEETDSTVTSQVKAALDDPKVFGYFISDEPNPYGCPNAPTQHKGRSELIHSIDATKPTVIVLDSNGFSGLFTQDALNQMPLWKGTADYIGLDPYPCRQGSPCDFSWIDKTIQAANAAGLNYWGVLQAFNDSSWRWPTPSELAHMANQWAASNETGSMVFAWTWDGYNLIDHPDLLAVLQAFNTGTLGSLDTTPPTAPTGLAASAAATSVSLAWTASTDNVGVTGYNLYNGGSLVGTTTSTSYTVGSLACGTAYTLGVAAQDAAGNVSSTTSIKASTSACADPVIAAAGDICGSATDCAPTANLIGSITPTAVLPLGDNAYSSGSATEYANYYDPNWGRYKAIT